MKTTKKLTIDTVWEKITRIEGLKSKQLNKTEPIIKPEIQQKIRTIILIDLNPILESSVKIVAKLAPTLS